MGVFSTSEDVRTYGGVQYIGKCSVHWGVFSTSEDVQYIGGVQYIRRIS